MAYTEEFRKEAVKQVTKNGYSLKDTAERLGVDTDFRTLPFGKMVVLNIQGIIIHNTLNTPYF